MCEMWFAGSPDFDSFLSPCHLNGRGKHDAPWNRLFPSDKFLSDTSNQKHINHKHVCLVYAKYCFFPFGICRTMFSILTLVSLFHIAEKRTNQGIIEICFWASFRKPFPTAFFFDRDAAICYCPTLRPSDSPSARPSVWPSVRPTVSPTDRPSV